VSLANALGARLLAGRAFELEAVPDATLLILAVPDAAVPEVAQRLPVDPPPGSAVVHTSGALTLDAIRPARERGWAVGGFHPLRPFPEAQPPPAFSGITIAVDASTPGVLAGLELLAKRLGATPHRVTDDERAIYHAAAVTGSNYAVALVAEAAALLESVGWSRADSLAAVSALMRASLDGVDAEGLPGALTGPIQRGDVATVRRHLEALKGTWHARVYRILGLAALRLAREGGLDEATAQRIEEALTG
jgi:predicted short-subunit dehydrogenase-like oxidoreductase (DUF2520 family)